MAWLARQGIQVIIRIGRMEAIFSKLVRTGCFQTRIPRALDWWAIAWQLLGATTTLLPQWLQGSHDAMASNAGCGAMQRGVGCEVRRERQG